jgi:CubicO group peptidase (beta-lactamase class C family)
LAEAIRDDDVPIFSLLISVQGKLIFELYTSSVERDDAHYLMSVTKSVVSTLIGIAIDQRLIPAAETPLGAELPPGLFESEAARDRFLGVTLRQVMAMSAVDAPLWPHVRTAEATERQRAFWASDDRVRFALAQPLLPSPGTSFQYNDVSPMIAVGLLQCASKMSALDFAAVNLFGPLAFRNYSWEHQDRAGFDNGGYGLRLRPIDLQKLGLLYLRGGDWNGRHILPRDWVQSSLTPWIRTAANSAQPTYGWFWWTVPVAPGWVARTAQGWKGQKLAIFPEHDLVVTMTGSIENGREDDIFGHILKAFIIPAFGAEQPPAHSALPAAALSDVLAQVQLGPHRAASNTEFRMIPSNKPRGRHRQFDPSRCGPLPGLNLSQGASHQ